MKQLSFLKVTLFLCLLSLFSLETFANGEVVTPCKVRIGFCYIDKSCDEDKVVRCNSNVNMRTNPTVSVAIDPCHTIGVCMLHIEFVEDQITLVMPEEFSYRELGVTHSTPDNPLSVFHNIYNMRHEMADSQLAPGSNTFSVKDVNTQEILFEIELVRYY